MCVCMCVYERAKRRTRTRKRERCVMSQGSLAGALGCGDALCFVPSSGAVKMHCIFSSSHPAPLSQFRIPPEFGCFLPTLPLQDSASSPILPIGWGPGVWALVESAVGLVCSHAP